MGCSSSKHPLSGLLEKQGSPRHTMNMLASPSSSLCSPRSNSDVSTLLLKRTWPVVEQKLFRKAPTDFGFTCSVKPKGNHRLKAMGRSARGQLCVPFLNHGIPAGHARFQLQNAVKLVTLRFASISRFAIERAFGSTSLGE